MNQVKLTTVVDLIEVCLRIGLSKAEQGVLKGILF